MIGNSSSNRVNVVIGGGLLGLLVAWYLSSAGESVAVFDRQKVGREASWAGGGILSPVYPSRYPALHPLVVASHQEYLSIACGLQGLTDIDPEFCATELLILDEAENPSAAGLMARRTVSGSELRVLEPNINKSIANASAYSVSHVRSPRFLRALRVALQRKGVIFFEQRKIDQFAVHQGRVVGVSTNGEIVPASRCFVTAGAWASGLLESVGTMLPIKPIRGQMVAFAAMPYLVSRIIVRDYRYLIPRADGLILAGSTLEDVGFNKHITNAARNDLHQFAVDVIPALRPYPVIHHWAGLRPGSPDDLPFIGEHPTVRALFVCAGHHRNGFACGPASAKLVVDMALGRQPIVNPAPFRVDRAFTEWRM